MQTTILNYMHTYTCSLLCTIIYLFYYVFSITHCHRLALNGKNIDSWESKYVHDNYCHVQILIPNSLCKERWSCQEI